MFFPTAHHIFCFEDVLLFVFVPPSIYFKKRFGKIWRGASHDCSHSERNLDHLQSVMEYEEHEKRAWSVDFSRTEPSMLVSGSDDGKVCFECQN